MDLQHRVEELEAAAAERAGVLAAQDAELTQLRGDLAHARAEGLALAEDKARLEVRGCRAGQMGGGGGCAACVRAAHITASQRCVHPYMTLLRAGTPAGLQVEAKRAQRDFQTAEVLGLSLREQLTARESELRELGSRHSALQTEQASWWMAGQGRREGAECAVAWNRLLGGHLRSCTAHHSLPSAPLPWLQVSASAALAESQASLTSLQLQHDSLQASSAERAAQLEAALAAEREAHGQAQQQLSSTEAERQALQKSLEETAAREAAVTAQLKQLAGAHEQQTSKLRQESNSRRNADDELAAIRAGLQVGRLPCCGWCCLAFHRLPSLQGISGLPGRCSAGHAAATGGPRCCSRQQRRTPHCRRGVARHRTHQHGSAGMPAKAVHEPSCLDLLRCGLPRAYHICFNQPCCPAVPCRWWQP